MDIPQQGNEILNGVNRLTSEPVLKQVTVTLIFLVEIMGVCHGYSLNDITDVLFTLLYQQMELVAHQAIGIEHTEGRKPYPLLIIPLRLPSKM